MSAPEALISHQIPGRVRIKVPSQKENGEYFSALENAFSQMKGVESIKSNPLTASVLFMGKNCDSASIAEQGEKNGVFRMVDTIPKKTVLPQKVTEPIRSLNACLGRLTSGEVDFAGILFLILLATGAVQILRGRFNSPPWYTAYWYAFGVFRNLLGNKKVN